MLLQLAGLVSQHVLLHLPHHHQAGQHLLQREPDTELQCFSETHSVSVYLLNSWVENQTGESGTQLLSGWR